jgi:hypothetical protein
MSFVVLVDILQDDAQDQEQVHPVIFISLHLKYISRTREIQLPDGQEGHLMTKPLREGPRQ